VSLDGLAMILVLEDDACVHVYDSIVAVTRQVEALDADSTLLVVFDESGQRFALRWLKPNRTWRDFLGTSAVQNGAYTLEPVGAPEPTALLAVLVDAQTILPAERESDVRALQQSLKRA
jgi:hypothetical protein